MDYCKMNPRQRKNPDATFIGAIALLRPRQEAFYASALVTRRLHLHIVLSNVGRSGDPWTCKGKSDEDNAVRTGHRSVDWSAGTRPMRHIERASPSLRESDASVYFAAPVSRIFRATTGPRRFCLLAEDQSAAGEASANCKAISLWSESISSQHVSIRAFSSLVQGSFIPALSPRPRRHQ